MRKQLLVLGACTALIFGAMGCSDDDVIPLAPTTQAAYDTTQTIVTGVGLVTAIQVALAGPVLVSESANLGDGCSQSIDISEQICTSGSASLCLDEPLSVSAENCEVEGVGAVSGTASLDKSGSVLTLDLTVNGTSISGTVTDVPSEEAGVFCQTADYDVEVRDLGPDPVALIRGEIEGCEDDTLYGEPEADIPALPATFHYTFKGSSATIDVFELGKLEQVGVCTLATLDSVPVCESL